MYRVDVYLRVRRAVMVEGRSIREVSREFGLHRDTVRKMLTHSVPPGYRRQTPPRRPKLELFTGVIDRILEDDLKRSRKQRHTAKRIFDRLRDEYGYDGGYTTVKDYVRENRRQTREMFVPLSHAPGHAQCDFGEALVVIGGVERKTHCFVIDLPHSDGCFVKAYPAETTEAFLDGHVSAFAFLGGVPQSILYDNTRLAVAKILGDGRRQRTRAFTELQSHYLFEDRFGRPDKGNDKGKVEGLVGYMRRNFLVPVPSFESFDALNAYLEQRCLERMDAQLRGHTETIGQRMERDLDALLPSILREYGKMAALCAAEGVDHPQYLLRLAELELIDRHQRMVERRIRAARFPAVKSLDTLDFPAIPSLNKALVMELARCEYIQRRENVIAIGNSGTGKTHVALGLGLAACQRGMSVGFTTAAGLVHEMMEARDDRRLLNLQKQLARLNLLIIDELGFVPLSRTGAELLFEVFSQRYERGSVMVTTNLPFDEWTEVFGSERLTGALLDRLTHHVHILEMNGESYRLKRSRENAAPPPPAEPDEE